MFGHHLQVFEIKIDECLEKKIRGHVGKKERKRRIKE
jgi:hypothetical protein